VTGSDPVELGLVASLNHPGGNATGFTALEYSMGGKWLGLLKARRCESSARALPGNLDNSPPVDTEAGFAERGIEPGRYRRIEAIAS
jgi:hypothetical protein